MRIVPALVAACTLLVSLACAGATGAPPEPDRSRSGSPHVQEVPLRVHLLRSAEAALDGSRGIDGAGVERRLQAINQIFAAAGVRFTLESVKVEDADPKPWREAIRSNARPVAALSPLVPVRSLPDRGLDMYVVRDLSPVGIGGAFICAEEDGARRGVVFVPTHGKGGREMAIRKWAHELGHLLGLNHTPCEAAHADRLMMSGKCRHANHARADFSNAEIARVQTQAAQGKPRPCGEGRRRR